MEHAETWVAGRQEFSNEVFKERGIGQVWWCPHCYESWSMDTSTFIGIVDILNRLDDFLIYHLKANRVCADAIFTVNPDEVEDGIHL